MLNLDDSYKKLLGSKELKDFKSKNKSAFLYACFFVSEGNWQFDFYNPKDEMITTLEVSDKGIKVMPVDKAFKDDRTKISELHVDKVKMGFDEAVKLVNDFVSKQYPGDKFFTKTIAILQNLDNKVTWNITLLTSTLKLLNVKLDASSGKVVSHCIESFLTMK
ncbi:MAG: hypothetical protein V1645_02600 [archaeon]